MTDQTLKDIDRAFKALEERDELLDKIRTEIDQLPSELTPDGRRMIRQVSVLRIIDEYKAESEEV